MIRYCVSICEKDLETSVSKLKHYESTANLVEIRFDHFAGSELSGLRKQNLRNVIFTLRNHKNGGHFIGDEDKRIHLLKSLLELNPGYLDIEFDLPARLIKWFIERKGKTKIILSYHNFDNTPKNLQTICERMIKFNPDVLKVVTSAGSIKDNITNLQLIERFGKEKKIVSHSMGERGEISRLLGAMYGNYFTFASGDDKITAPGQISIEKLRNDYNIQRLKKNFKLFGLLGNPVKHSHGYLIHNFAFTKSSTKAFYVNFLADSVEEFLTALSDKVSGLSVTIPFKQQILPYLDKIDDNSAMIGAVNTVIKKNQKFYGYNTDYIGFLNALKKYVTPKNKHVVILGAGGSARAVLVSLLDKKNEITVLGRNLEKVKALADEFGCSYDDINNFSDYAPQILINTTPVGMYPNVEQSPVRIGKLRNCFVFDLVYNPYHTQLLKKAVGNGNQIISGFEMFLHQAEEQFRLFTGKNFSYLRHRNYFLKKLHLL